MGKDVSMTKEPRPLPSLDYILVKARNLYAYVAFRMSRSLRPNRASKMGSWI